MITTVVGKISCLFSEMIMLRGKNNPLTTSLHLNVFYTFLYNLSTLVSDTVPSLDNGLSLPSWYNYFKNTYIPSLKTDNNNMLDNLIYYGASAMLQLLYGNNATTNKSIKEFYNVDHNDGMYLISLIVKRWAQDHYNVRKNLIETSPFSTDPVSFDTTSKVDAELGSDGNAKFVNPLTSDKWVNWNNLTVPSGVVKNSDGTPIIDPTNTASYKNQKYLGNTWGSISGFSITNLDTDFNIADVQSNIPLAWDDSTQPTDLKREIDAVLKIYANSKSGPGVADDECLSDKNKTIAEVFAGSDKTVLPPPGQMMMVANMLSQKYGQSQLRELCMYFTLSCGCLDASIAAWWYKNKFNQARPVTMIRSFKGGDIFTSWTPNKGFQTIKGGQWVPFQDTTFVTPPFPDFASGHSVFSTCMGELLIWWFNSKVLYDSSTLVEMPNPKAFSTMLNGGNTLCLLGKFSVAKGSSVVESISPSTSVDLTFNTINDLYLACGKSRVYGGIHTNNTNILSQEIGKSIVPNIQIKLATIGVSSPYYNPKTLVL